MNGNGVELSMVVAMTPERVIGRGGTMPWERIPSDLARFRHLTRNVGMVVMGHSTHEAIVARNRRPLRGRHSIVLTRSPRADIDDLQFVDSVEAALDQVARRGGRACVIGGGEIYRLFLPYTQRAFVTVVETPVTGDTTFPELDPMEWTCVQRLVTRKYDERDLFPTSHEVWKRDNT